MLHLKSYLACYFRQYCRFSTSLISIFFLMIISLPSHAEILSWKDKNGRVHFGDKIIKGVKQENVKLNIQKSQWKRFIIEVNDIDNILTAKERQRIETDVNTVYQFFDKKLYFDFYKTVPVKIRLFEKQRSYHNYLSEQGSTNGNNSRGMYFPSTNEIVLYLNQKDRWRTFWTIKHEVSHAIIDSLTPYTPAWLNEGLAENMESLGLREGVFFLYSHNENKRSASRSEKTDSRLKVKRLLSLSNRDYYEGMRNGYNIYQAHSGELIRMLLSKEVGQRIIRRMIHTYKRGSRTYSSHLIDKHYVGGLTILQVNWNAWISRTNSKKILL